MTKFLNIPLQVQKSRIDRTDNVKRSIDAFLAMILNTPTGSVPCDPLFGFSLQKRRFEMIDESQGTIFNGQDANSNPDYEKKMSGTSKNMQTYAADLNNALKLYEPRLTDTNVSLTYISASKTIVVVIKGIIKETKEEYKYTDTIKLWT